MQSRLNLKCDVGARDSAGKTSLLTAIIDNCIEAADSSLRNGANALIADKEGQSPMQVFFNKCKFVRKLVTVEFFERFKTIGFSVEEMAKILVEANCPLDNIVLIKDPKVIQAVLEKKKFIDACESDLAMSITLNADDSDAESVRVLLQYGSRKEFRKHRFFEYLTSLMCNPDGNLTAAESYVKHLVSWEIIGESELDHLNGIFVRGSKDAVRMLLRYNIHDYAIDKFGKNLIASLFEQVNAVEIIEDTRFCVNMPYRHSQTPLHIAASRNFSRSIEFLLNKGADPNARDSQGLTPLFYTVDVDCIKLLWQRGADIQVLANVRGSNHLLLSKLPVIAYLAIIEGRGVTLKREIRDGIESSRFYSQYYEKCKRQIDWMKNQMMFDAITLFDALDRRKVDEFARYVKTEPTVETVLRGFADSALVAQYYSSILKENFDTALRLHNYRRRVALAISESTGIVDSDHLVVEKIVNLLSYKDLYKDTNDTTATGSTY